MENCIFLAVTRSHLKLLITESLLKAAAFLHMTSGVHLKIITSVIEVRKLDLENFFSTTLLSKGHPQTLIKKSERLITYFLSPLLSILP